MTEVAIVGAGVGGVATAYALRDAPVEVTVFEARSEVCGRAATRRREGCTYDYGANYLKSEDDRVNALVEDLGTDGLVDVPEPVWTFDADGSIGEGRDVDEHKWSYESGLAHLGERLLTAAGVTVHRETRVAGLAREGDRWRLAGDDDTGLGVFDALVLNPPAPRTAALLRDADWNAAAREDLVAAAEAVPYRTVYAAVLHYGFELDRPYYALVNVDKAHEVGWVARESCKPGHVPDGEELLVVQMAPDWSVARGDDDPAAVCADAAELVAGLLDDARLRDPDWTDHCNWRYALADGRADAAALDAAADYDLYCTGDWVAGKARVHAALRDGLETGERIAGATGGPR